MSTTPDDAIRAPWTGLVVGERYLYSRPSWERAEEVVVEDSPTGLRLRFRGDYLPVRLGDCPVDGVFRPVRDKHGRERAATFVGAAATYTIPRTDDVTRQVPEPAASPVLSAEQWAALEREYVQINLDMKVCKGLRPPTLHLVAGDDAITIEEREFAPLAAVLLDMLGIVTREDVDRLRRAVVFPPGGIDGDTAALHAFADRLSPLLPPREDP